LPLEKVQAPQIRTLLQNIGGRETQETLFPEALLLRTVETIHHVVSHLSRVVVEQLSCFSDNDLVFPITNMARKRGVLLGRRTGTTLTRDQFLQKHKDILRQLKAGHSVRNVAKIVDKGISTVQRVKAAVAV
jgi:hypothetical protein